MGIECFNKGIAMYAGLYFLSSFLVFSFSFESKSPLKSF